MTWSLGDVIENRPALSRWHPECQSSTQILNHNEVDGVLDKARFDEFVASSMSASGRSRSRGRPSERDQ